MIRRIWLFGFLLAVPIIGFAVAEGFAVIATRNCDPPSAANTRPLLKKRFSKFL